MSIPDKSWQVYRSAFKDGEQVVLEDAQGKFHWGELKTTNDGITLTRISWSASFAWVDIVFLAHDGFPVREIMGMTEEEAEFRAKQTPTRVIRDKLLGLVQTHEHIPEEHKPPPKPPPKPRMRHFGGGCPFVYGPCSVEHLLWPGNNGPQWWGEDGEETLVLRSVDGAIAHSFDLSHLFLFDGLEL